MKLKRVRFCKSKSSNDVLTHMHVARAAGSSKETTEFVNHGLLLWNQGRQKWIGHRKVVSRSRLLPTKLRTLRFCMGKRFGLYCWNASDNSLLRSSKSLSKPTPLSEMVEVLVDIWEQEGI